jgi:hypothetical protein
MNPNLDTDLPSSSQWGPRLSNKWPTKKTVPLLTPLHTTTYPSRHQEAMGEGVNRGTHNYWRRHHGNRRVLCHRTRPHYGIKRVATPPPGRWALMLEFVPLPYFSFILKFLFLGIDSQKVVWKIFLKILVHWKDDHDARDGDAHVTSNIIKHSMRQFWQSLHVMSFTLLSNDMTSHSFQFDA